MRPHCYFAFTLLCSLSLLSPVLSIQCNDTQYEWPMKNPKYCCNKCRPGEHMTRRSDPCIIKCKPCGTEMYKDVHSVALSCKFCDSCNQANMEYESPCNATHNAVCRCKAGYECKDQPCKDCVPIQTTTNPTTPIQTTTNPTTPIQTTTNPTTPLSTTVSMESVRSRTQAMTPLQPLRDTMWFLVIIALLAVGIAVIVLTKIKPLLRWIRSTHVDLFKTPVPTSEDTEVSQPVQDTCGKCDQPLV